MYIHQRHIRLVGGNRSKFENMGGNMEPHYCKYAYRKNGDVSLHCRYLTEKGARHGKRPTGQTRNEERLNAHEYHH